MERHGERTKDKLRAFFAALKAAEVAINSPLLDDISVDGATGVLINVVGGPDMRMKEIEEAATLVQEQAHEDANIIFGATVDETMGDAIKVTVIATGFDHVVAEVPQYIATTRGSSSSLGAVSSPGSALGARPTTSAPPMSARAAVPVQTQRPPMREEPAYPSRRPAPPPPPATKEAGQTNGGRERATFVPPLDSEWDTPAFQRRGQ